MKNSVGSRPRLNEEATKPFSLAPFTPRLLPAGLRTTDLLSIGDLSAEEILLILDTAEAMQEVGTRAIQKVPALRGQTVVNLFFEASTRTRTTFEIAATRPPPDTDNQAASGSIQS